MKIKEYQVIAPFITGDNYNEAEVLGSVVWLWLHSNMHKKIPLDALPVLLLPAIKKKLFALFIRDHQPVGYISWLFLNRETEKYYLTNPPIMLRDSDWLSGDRLWCEDWVAPFGDSRQISQILRHQIFPDHIVRALYHRGDQRGIKIKTLWGANIPLQQVKQWCQDNPVNL